MHSLCLLLSLIQDLFEVAAVIYNRDVAVVEVYHAAVGWWGRNCTSVRNLLSLSEILLTFVETVHLSD